MIRIILISLLVSSFSVQAAKRSERAPSKASNVREITRKFKIDETKEKKKEAPKFNLKTTNGKFLYLFYHAKSKKDIAALKKRVLNSKGKAVPAIIEVMKNKLYPDKNRWLATFLLGRTMGKKSAPFIAKFLFHPNWVLRMASLKTLLALRARQYSGAFAKLLKDKSFIVRTQALDNIRQLKLRELSPFVWEMLYDQTNYYVSKQTKKNAKQRGTTIIKNVILTIGELQFMKAKGPLLKMAGKKKYDDIFDEIDYSLAKITGKKSPKGPKTVKKRFWQRLSMSNTSI